MDIETLETLSFLAKTPEEKQKLIEIHLKEKRQLEQTELHKQLQTYRAKHNHRFFITPRGQDN